MLNNVNVISECINELITIWHNWLMNHYICNDRSKSFAERRKAGETCEKLVKDRHIVISKINDYFDILYKKDEDGK